MTDHTPQQKRFIQQVDNENVALSARAGTGKTTTLVAAANATSKTVLAVAFNKTIAESLQARMPANCQSATLNSVGHRSVMAYSSSRLALDSDKNFKIFQAMGRGVMNKYPDIGRAIGICKAKCIIPNNAPFVPNGPFNERVNADWLDNFLSDHDDLDLGPGAGAVVYEALGESLRQTFQQSIIDFDDQVYIPAVYDTPLPNKEIVLVDEAQDLSPAQVAMLSKINAPLKHIVGDPFQAIYGFRGAGYGAFEWSRDHFNCTEMPLTVSFRCAKEIIRRARVLVPDIEADPNAPEGLVKEHSTWKLSDIQSTDAVLCRTNRPAIAMAYRMLTAGQSCHILGKDIGAGLKRWLRSSRQVLLRDAYVALTAYFKDRQELWKSSKRRLFQERLDILAFFIEAMGPQRTVDDLCLRIDQLFTDRKAGDVVTISTIHKAKGMEWNRVWFLNPHECPAPWAGSSPDARQQEDNLIYVAITRARHELHYIKEEDRQ